MLVFGTRPEAIKMAPLVKEFEKYPEQFKTVVCVTGQHREMLDQVLHLFEIHPDYDLNIMKQGQDLYDVTARVLTGMRDVLKEVQPDLVLVHGDTTTSTASALAAFYQQIPVGHVEAGLRTHNIYSPWPEEMNRLITGRIATYHFSPTQLSCQNLLDEGVKQKSILVTGNTVIDALYLVVDKIKGNEALQKVLTEELKTAGYEIRDCRLVLITGHRRENFGEGFIQMCKAIKTLAEKYPESYDKAVPDELVYSGKLKLTDSVEGSPLDAGKLVLSPTRTYAPVVKKLLDALRPEIHGMVHCSGGAQTKVLHFVGDNCRVVKDNLFPVPPLFRTIKEQSDTDWSEMYKVFNIGHRLEVYLSPEHAEEVIAISKSFNIDAQIVGRIEESDKKELIIKSEFGEFRY